MERKTAARQLSRLHDFIYGTPHNADEIAEHLEVKRATAIKYIGLLRQAGYYVFMTDKKQYYLRARK